MDRIDPVVACTYILAVLAVVLSWELYRLVRFALSLKNGPRRP